MTTEQLQRKLQRIILDLNDLAGEQYLDSESKIDISAIASDLEKQVKHIYSTDL